MSKLPIAFYVMAHQDDWQLFRGDQAWIDLNESGARIVFVYTTAGDAGRTDGWWEARERGGIASIRAAIPASPLTFHIRTFNGHPIASWDCGNTTSYCMRLPDGILDKLRERPLAAVDGSTTYTGWADFVQTLRAILDTETEASSSEHPWVNAPDYNPKDSPSDHQDHIATGQALREFVTLDSRYSRVWWVGYDVKTRDPNVSGDNLVHKKKLFDAYAAEVLAETTRNGKPTQRDDALWERYGTRNYCSRRLWDTLDPDPVP
jgi:hypothetical protein